MGLFTTLSHKSRPKCVFLCPTSPLLTKTQLSAEHLFLETYNLCPLAFLESFTHNIVSDYWQIIHWPAINIYNMMFPFCFVSFVWLLFLECPYIVRIYFGKEISNVKFTVSDQPRSQGFSPPRVGRAPVPLLAVKSPGNQVGILTLSWLGAKQEPNTA